MAQKIFKEFQEEIFVRIFWSIGNWFFVRSSGKRFEGDMQQVETEKKEKIFLYFLLLLLACVAVAQKHFSIIQIKFIPCFLPRKHKKVPKKLFVSDISKVTH